MKVDRDERKGRGRGGDGPGDGEAPRVLLIANTLPPADVSGVGEQVLQLAAGLRAAGCEVEVLGRKEMGAAAQGAAVRFGLSPEGAAGPKVGFPLTVVPAAWRALRRFRPHVVQVHESDGAFAALLVRLLRPFLRPRPRLVALLQVSYVEERRAVRPLVAPDGRVMGEPGAVECRFRRGKGRLQVLLGRWTARLADRVLAPSRVTAAEVERDYRVAGGVAVLPNVTGGLPVTAEPVPPDVADAAPGALLFVGRLRIRKGVEVLLEALARLPPEGVPPEGSSSPAGAPRPLLLVAGDGEHRAALEARAAELDLAGRVRFLGRCSAGQVRTLLSRCRALVVPSTYEGMPLVILEAMEAAVPVVATRVSGIPEVVVDGVTGWVVPPEDPAALAAALAEVLAPKDPLSPPEGGPGDGGRSGSEADRRGRAGRQHLDRCYRPSHAAARWLETVLPERPGAPGPGPARGDSE